MASFKAFLLFLLATFGGGRYLVDTGKSGGGFLLFVGAFSLYLAIMGLFLGGQRAAETWKQE